jgi:hypothetical protein
MTRLAERLGYRLVGANQHGFNLFFAREDVPAVTVEDVLRRAGVPMTA